MRRLPPFRIRLGPATAGVAVLAAPAAWEGPVLVEISPGRAIALLDAFGIVPLTLGSAILYRELWVRRRRLTFSASNRPAAGLGMAFAGGARCGYGRCCSCFRSAGPALSGSTPAAGTVRTAVSTTTPTLRQNRI